MELSNTEGLKNFNDKLWIYGVGKRGSYCYQLIKNEINIRGFIDRRYQEIPRIFDECRVISPTLSEEYKKGDLIVICASTANTTEIENGLCEKGLVHRQDYYTFIEFIGEFITPYVFSNHRKLILPITQISVTERCTLKCDKCAHACALVSRDTPDLSIEQVKKSADSFFSYVDEVDEFVLIGGEPLLYRDLDKAVEYIGRKYRHCINNFVITTNGTILPKDELLNLCTEYDVFFDISNYSGALPRLKESYKRIINKLEERQIRYSLGDEMRMWMDYGFDHVDHKHDERILKSIFRNCKTLCHEVREDRFYYCVMARSVAENMYEGAIGKDDYYQLKKEVNMDERKRFLDYLTNGEKKGYLEMCNHCNGTEATRFLIPAAVQRMDR